jgi:uncharacterized RDD family membrane protein YckC
MSVSTSTGDAVERVRVIGFGRRLAAMAIDAVIIAFLTFVIGFTIGFIFIFFEMFNQQISGDLVAPTIVITGIIFSMFYWIGGWSGNGQSLGQSTLGITVIGEDGGKLSRGKAFVRYIGFLVSSLLMGLGFLWIAFDRKRQGLHDKMAGSYVVSMDDDFPEGTNVEFVPHDAGRGWVWALIWAIIAIATPIGAVSIYLTLGPSVGRFMVNLVGG